MQYSKNLILDELRLLIKRYVNENNLIIKNNVKINKKNFYVDGVKIGEHCVQLCLEDILGQIYIITHALNPSEMNKLMPAGNTESVSLLLEDSFTYPERDMIIYKQLREKRTPTIRKYLKRVIKQQEMIWNIPACVNYITPHIYDDGLHLFVLMENSVGSAAQIKNIQFPKIYFNELKFLSELPTTSLSLYLSDTMDDIWDIRLIYPNVKLKTSKEEVFPTAETKVEQMYDFDTENPVVKAVADEIQSTTVDKNKGLVPSDDTTFKDAVDAVRYYSSSEIPNMQSWTAILNGGNECKH